MGEFEHPIKIWEASSKRAFAEGDNWNGRYYEGVAHGIRLALGPAEKSCNKVNATEALEQESCAGCEGSRNRNLIECDVCGKRLR